MIAPVREIADWRVRDDALRRIHTVAYTRKARQGVTRRLMTCPCGGRRVVCHSGLVCLACPRKILPLSERSRDLLAVIWPRRKNY